MSGRASGVQIAAFLLALRTKGETIAEVRGLADAMISHALPLNIPGRKVDLVGTGGDRANTVNISTMAAIVVAGAGVQIIKHGNRAASSLAGSADLLEALGINLDLTPDSVAAIARELGITFCFAMTFHPSMRYAGPTRRELGVATVFNFLGPLTNPARVDAAAIGVSDARMAPIVAGVLKERGTDALVCRSEDGLDELSPTAPSRIWHISAQGVHEEVIDWRQGLGIARVDIGALRGGDAATNAQVAQAVFAGEIGPVRDAVVLNAAAALVADGTLPGTGEGKLRDRMGAGVAIARHTLDSGAARELLGRWVASSAAHSASKPEVPFR